MSLVTSRFIRRGVAFVASVAFAGIVGGCSSSGETAQADKLTANVGSYSAAPSVAYHPRVGVPSFSVTTGPGGFGGGNGKQLDDLAADQMNTLLYKTGRFDVIERTQLKKLIDEQNLEGIVKSGELAKTGQVHGVDYLLIGKVTNLRVKQQHSSNGFGLAQVGGLINLGGADVKKDKTEITTECGVDIRLVDPTTGKVMVASDSEFKRTDTAGGMGIAILGANAHSDNSIQLSSDDQGKVLRLALDDALRKALPDIDAFLTGPNARKAPAAATANPAPVTPVAPAAPAQVATPAAPAATPAAATKFCSQCGEKNPATAKFCGKCGAKME